MQGHRNMRKFKKKSISRLSDNKRCIVVKREFSSDTSFFMLILESVHFAQSFCQKPVVLNCYKFMGKVYKHTGQSFSGIMGGLR